MEYFKELLRILQHCSSLKNTEKKAEITVFLALIFSVISMLILALIESSEINLSKVKMESIVNISADSAFSEYDKYLFERYGLLYIDTTYKGQLQGKEDSLINHLSQYVDVNLDDDSSGPMKITYVASMVNNCRYGEENDDYSLKKQIKEYMEHYIHSDIESEIIDEYIKRVFSSKISYLSDTVHKYEIEYIICGFEGDETCLESLKDRIIEDRIATMCDEQNCHPFDDIFDNYEDREQEVNRFKIIKEEAENIDDDIYEYYLYRYLSEASDSDKLKRIRKVITDNMRNKGNKSFDFSNLLYEADITICLENGFGKTYEGVRHYSF